MYWYPCAAHCAYSINKNDAIIEYQRLATCVVSRLLLISDDDVIIVKMSDANKLFADRVSGKGNAIGRVRLSVRSLISTPIY